MSKPIVRIGMALGITLVLLETTQSCFAARDCLVDGGFEQIDASGMPIGWVRAGDHNGKLLLSDDQTAFGGKRSAKILPTVDATPSWRQEVPCTPGKLYRAQAMCKVWQIIGSTMGVFLEWRDAHGRPIEDKSVPRSYCLTGGCVGTVDWRIIQTQGVAPTNAARAVIRLVGDNGNTAHGTTWCDDAKLLEMDAPGDWGQFKPNPSIETLLSDFCWDFDRAVIGCAYLEDAVRGLRRAACYDTAGQRTRAADSIEERLASAQRSLVDLRGRYLAVYPLAHGKAGNGWPTPLAEYRAAYRGDPDVAKELRALTVSAKALVDAALAGLQACAGARESKSLHLGDAWAAPDLTGSDPKELYRLFQPDGQVDRILFGGGHLMPPGRFRHTRLMQYDYDMQWYENLDWPKRDQVIWHDDALFGPFAKHNVPIQMEVTYTPHTFCYSAPWLWPEIVSDPDAFLTEGAAPRKNAPYPGRHFLVNYNHPKVAAMLDEYNRLIATHFRGNANIVFFRSGWEAYDGGPGGDAGRDKYSFGQFRGRLTTQLGTIEKLNAAWGTAYRSFADIQPPPRTVDHPEQPPTPLLYAFQAFRKTKFMDWWARGYQTYKQYDPTHPHAVDPSMFPYGCDNYGAVDCTRLAETADIISLHGVSPQTLFRYTYSIGRYAPHKTFANLEYYWNAPEGWSGPTEAVSAAAGERNLWQGVALGLRVFQFYGQNDTFVSFPSRDQSSYNNLADFETDYSVLLPCAGVVPLMRAKLNALRPVWFDAQVESPQVGIYQPSTAANHPDSARLVYEAARTFEELCEGENLPYAAVFEEAVLAGKDDFARYTAICLPNAVVLPKQVSQQLVRFVQRGGLLIAAGPFGLWDVNVRKDETALRALGLSANGAPLQDAPVGKGRVLMTTDPLLQPPTIMYWLSGWGPDLSGKMIEKEAALAQHQRQRARTRATIRDALLAGTIRTAATNHADVKVIVREGKNDRTRYVVVYNQNRNRAAKTTLAVRGKWKQIVDLGIAGGWPVNAMHTSQGVVFPIVLGPGEGTVIQLTQTSP